MRRCEDLRKQTEAVLEAILRTCFFWTTTDAEFGEMVLAIHNIILALLFGWYLSVRIFSLPPVFVYGLLFAASIGWTQHLLLGVCLLSSIQKRMLGTKYAAMTHLLNVFGIPDTPETSRGVLLLLSCMIMILIGIEVVRTFLRF